MVENIANKFERTMKKGFVNLFVLLALNKEPTHGYQIKKLIEERTFGFWKPTDSTIYTILKDLHDKGLIRQSELEDTEDSKKVYELTEKGKKMLDLMIKRERDMIESLRAIIFSTTDIDQSFIEEGIQDFILHGPKFSGPPVQGVPMKSPFMGFFKGDLVERIKHMPKEEQYRILNFQKEFVAKQIKHLNRRLKDIDKLISNLESDIKI